MGTWKMDPNDVTLDEITGHPDGERVVSFQVQGDRLHVSEMCDQFFSAALTGKQVDRLIAWLVEARQRL